MSTDTTQELKIEKTSIDLDFCSYKKEVKDPPQLAEGQKPLPKMTVDGEVVTFMPGDTIMQALERVTKADDIPRFCYHPGMPIAGTCRMCTVEVEKAPKLMTSCSTPAGDGMVVHTKSEKVLKSRNGVMEFLLANHPLDCPVCDKAGECDLQDYDFKYGPSTSRFVEEKRVFEEATTKKLSDKVTLNMNRCVHCERCVRFTEDTTKTYDLVMLNRGYKKELAAADERGLVNDYQGCLTDFCPVGALTFNDFRFEKRVWFLQKNASVCDGCAKGCNIEVHSNKDVVYRYMPIFNEKVNGHWMCDDGRLSYHTYADTSRIIAPMIDARPAKLEATMSSFKRAFESGQSVLVIVGTDVTNREAKMINDFMNSAGKGKITLRYYNGTNGVTRSSDNKALDNLLRQSDLTPNTKGVELLGFQPLSNSDFHGKDHVVFFRGGRAAIPSFESNAKLHFVGVFQRSELETLQQKGKQVAHLIPGLATIEKAGSYTNCDGITQHFEAAVTHKGSGVSVDAVLSFLKIETGV